MRIQNTTQNNSGFTLIELLLYVSISAVILLAVSVFLSTLLQSRIKNQTIAEVEQQGLAVMRTITQTVRNSAVINTPTEGLSTETLSVDTYRAGNNPIIYDLSAGAIRIKEGIASPIELTNGRVVASALNFENLSHTDTPGIIRIAFTLTHLNPEGRNEYLFNKTFIGSASLRQP